MMTITVPEWINRAGTTKSDQVQKIEVRGMGTFRPGQKFAAATGTVLSGYTHRGRQTFRVTENGLELI